jgi:drug/metabolite transporter (DMT)-like permease
VAINGIVRQVNLPPCQIICLQNIFGAFFLALFFGSFPLSAFYNLFSYGRAFFALPGTLFWVFSLKCLPLWQAVALGFLGPFVTTLLSKVFLKEHIGAYRMCAIILGVIAGSLFTLPQTGFCNNSWNIAFPIIATLSFSFCHLAGKKLSQTETAHSMAFSLMVLLGVSLFFTWPLWQIPSLEEWLTLVGLGALASFAHFSMNQSLICSDLSFLIPFGSARFIGTALIGFLCYHEIPSPLSFIGMGLTLFGLWLLSFEK